MVSFRVAAALFRPAAEGGRTVCASYARCLIIRLYFPSPTYQWLNYIKTVGPLAREKFTGFRMAQKVVSVAPETELAPYLS